MSAGQRATATVRLLGPGAAPSRRRQLADSMRPAGRDRHSGREPSLQHDLPDPGGSAAPRAQRTPRANAWPRPSSSDRRQHGGGADTTAPTVQRQRLPTVRRASPSACARPAFSEAMSARKRHDGDRRLLGGARSLSRGGRLRRASMHRARSCTVTPAREPWLQHELPDPGGRRRLGRKGHAATPWPLPSSKPRLPPVGRPRPPSRRP